MQRNCSYFFKRCTLLMLVSLLLLNACGEDQSANYKGKRVIILGFDGMSPSLVDEFMREQQLPNFKRLRDLGSYKRLKTSNPPQSPVAWANFITGNDPGGHGIFDFIHRSPKDYLPYLSISRTEAPEQIVKIGKWNIPLKPGQVHNLRQGKAFWEFLGEAGVPVTVFRIPSNFPPVESPGRFFSGMGTPDIRGTYGMFTYYSDVPVENDSEVSGGVIHLATLENETLTGEILGPINSFVREKSKTGRDQGHPVSKVSFQVQRDLESRAAKISVGKKEFLLQQGEWSDWVQLKFQMMPLFVNVYGIVRFYLKEAAPNFKLYITPVNIDPCKQSLPISHPPEYGCELVEKFGYFHTLGMPEDTKALDQGVLDDKDFLVQAKSIYQEQLNIFEHEFTRLDEGLLFYYFSSTDLISHMFWRTMDPSHPMYRKNEESEFKNAILHAYQDMDAVLGSVLPRLTENDTLIVLSDHGFAPYYTSFHLNSWLMDNGYLTLYDDTDRENMEFLDGVDWSRTRAYGLGFNSLYLNLAGREGKGTVPDGMIRQQLLEEINTKLLNIVEPETGKKPIFKMYKTKENYNGIYAEKAPEAIVGYNLGYRASWESAIGKVPEGWFKKNQKRWSGDHCMAYDLLPGIVLTNRKIQAEETHIFDIAPTVLAKFGLSSEKEMKGKDFFLPTP